MKNHNWFSTKLTDVSSLIQTSYCRVIAEINPEKGTKCQTQAVQQAANCKANKLHNFFVAYKERLEDSGADYINPVIIKVICYL